MMSLNSICLEAESKSNDFDKYIYNIAPKTPVTSFNCLLRTVTDVHLSRSLSHRVLEIDHFVAQTNQVSTPVPLMGNVKPYPPLLPSREQYAVAFDSPQDPEIPINWTAWRKIRSGFAACLYSLSITIGLVMYVLAFLSIMEEVQVDDVYTSLATLLYVLGFAAGPVFFGPLSKMYGRKIGIFLSAHS